MAKRDLQRRMDVSGATVHSSAIAVSGGGVTASTSVHALFGPYHSGTLDRSQAPWVDTDIADAITVHAAQPDIHHPRQHSMTAGTDHVYSGGAALDIFGLTAPSTLGVHTPSANPGAATAILKSDSAGTLTLPTFVATTKVTTPTIDNTGNILLDPGSRLLKVDGIVRSSYNSTTTAGAVLQNVQDIDASYTRVVVGYNAAWDTTGKVWTIGNAAANDAAVFLVRNGSAAIDLIMHASAGSADRTMTHTEFTAGKKFIFTSSGRLGVNSVNDPTYNVDVTGSVHATVTVMADTSVQTPLITTVSNVDLVINPAGTGAVQFPNDQTLRTSSFDSSFPINGWQINEVPGISGYSALTIGKIQADELAVRVFVADEVRVDRGDEFWTKSYGIIAETFTSPASIGGTVSVMFEDSPALAGAIFTNDDWLLIRKLEIDTGISLFNLWGQVSGYVNNSDGTQNWTFTLRSGPTDESITKGSLAIDFGASGAALIHLSVIDAAGAPYIKMRRWIGANPYTPANFTTYVQLGHLGSIGNSYYTPAGYGLYIRSTANEGQFIVADDNGLQIRGAGITLWNGANQTVNISNTGQDIWVGTSSSDKRLVWDGASLTFNNSTGNAVIVLDNTGGSYFAGIMTIGTDGEIRQGLGTLGVDFTGLRIWRDSGVGRIAGYNTADPNPQWYAHTDGKIYAGGGALWLDSNGMSLAVKAADEDPSRLRFVDGATVYGTISYVFTAGPTPGPYDGMVFNADDAHKFRFINALITEFDHPVDATGLTVNDVAVSLEGHTHTDYLSTTGGTLTGTLITDVIRPAVHETDSVGTASFYYGAGYFDQLFVNTIVGTPSYSHTHPADEVTAGTFPGSYTITGSLDFDVDAGGTSSRIRFKTDNANEKVWDLTARAHDYATVGERNDLLLTYAEGVNIYLVATFDSGTRVVEFAQTPTAGGVAVSLSGHTHDDRYYTKSELNAGQLNSLYYTESEVNTLLAGYVPTSRTVSAGSGLTGGGALSANITLSHEDTSSQASVNNSGSVFIQDITLDPFGHVTAIGSTDIGTSLDSRYVNTDGDTMTGALAITGAGTLLAATATNATSYTALQLLTSGTFDEVGGKIGIRVGRTFDTPNRLVEFGYGSAGTFGQQPFFYVAPAGVEMIRISSAGAVISGGAMGSDHYAAATTGWNITYGGAADLATSLTVPSINGATALSINAASGYAIELKNNSTTVVSIPGSGWTTAGWVKSLRFPGNGYALVWDTATARGIGTSTDGVLYIARSTATDNSAAVTYDLTIDTAGNTTVAQGYIGGSNYASQISSWRVTQDGGGDFRYLYADQMHVKALIADLEQALAGGQIIGKSVAVLAEDFVVPYAGGQQILPVEDLPSAPNMAAFESGDFVRLRTLNRSSGSLNSSDCWGTVSNYTDGTGVQTWTFTRSGSTTYDTITLRGTATSSSSSSATSRAPSKPTGVVSGDTMIAVVTHDGAATTVTPPADWIELFYQSGTDINVGVYYKVAGSSEGSSYTFTISESRALAVGIIAYDNCNVTFLPYDDFSYSVNSASTSMIAPTVWSTSTAGMLLFVGGITNNSASTPPSGMTERLDTGSTGIRVYMADQLLVGGGDVGSRTATISASHANIAGCIMLKPSYVSFTTDTAGSLVPGIIISANDNLVLDYGTSGNGYHEVNAVDGAYGINSPYSQVVTWTTHPATGQIVRTRMGNLYGITAVSGEYGLYAGDGGITAGNQYLRVSTAGVQLNNVPIKLYNAGTQTVNLDNAGVDIWIGPSSGDKRLTFNGATFALNKVDIALYNGATQTVNISSTGQDIWVGPSSGDKRLSWNGTILSVVGAITVSSGSSGIASFSDANLDNIADGTTYGRLDKTIIAGGLIQVGSGTKDSTLSGWHISGSEIVGQASGVDQVVLNTSGKVSAGAGTITMDVSGLTALVSSTPTIRLNGTYGLDILMPGVEGSLQAITWRETINSGNPSAKVDAWLLGSATNLVLEANTSNTSPSGLVTLRAEDSGGTQAQFILSALSGGTRLASLTAGTFTVNADLDMNGNDIFDVASLGIGTTVSGAWTSSGWTKAVVFANQGTTLLWNKGASGVARGIGVSNNGVLYITRSTANDNSAAPSYDVTVETTGGVTMNPAAGTGALTLTTPASQTAAMLYISSADNGSSYGPFMFIGMNTNGSTPSAGFIQLVNRNFGSYNLWPDASGNLRIGTTTPTNAQDSSGTVVGTQTSSLDSKVVLGATCAPDEALQHVLEAASTALRRFRYKSGAYNDEEFEGIVTDYAPRYGMDRDSDHPAGKSLNTIQIVNDLLLCVQALNRRIEDLEGKDRCLTVNY